MHTSLSTFLTFAIFMFELKVYKYTEKQKVTGHSGDSKALKSFRDDRERNLPK